MVKRWRSWTVGLAVCGVLGAGVIATNGALATESPQVVTSAATVSTDAVASESAAEKIAAVDTTGIVAAAADAPVGVSALDLTTGESVTVGDDAFDTASIVKVDILVALLVQAQADGTTLTSSQQALASAMIRYSDNVAATSLFEAVGGKQGLDAMNAELGLTSTVVGSSGNWGLTQTTAADQITLLKIVFGEDSPLTAASQAYIASLMSTVVDSQNFGVSAAADDADDAALKVGYLQRSATGLWDVTSIGEVESGGHTYLIAVLTDSNSSFDAGVDLVDDLAVAAVAALQG